MALSAESLVLEIGTALGALGKRLRDSNPDQFFPQLGMPAPTIVLGSPGVSQATSTLTASLGSLPEAVATLSEAIEAEDLLLVIDGTRDLADLIIQAAASVDSLNQAVRNSAALAGQHRADVEAFAGEFAERLFGLAVISHLQEKRQTLAQILELVGVIEISAHAATPSTPAHVRRLFHFEYFSQLLRDPTAVFSKAYGWGTAALDWDTLLRRLAVLFDNVARFSFVQPGEPPFIRIAFFDIAPSDGPVPGIQLGVREQLEEAVDKLIEIRPGLQLEIAIETAVEAGAAIELRPPADLIIVPPTAAVSGKVRAGLALGGGPADPIELLGIAGGTRLEAEKFRLSTGADLAWDLGAREATGELVIETAIEGGNLIISLDGADGFLGAILPKDGIKLGFDLLVGWSASKGLYFEGGANLALDIPVNFDLGPIKVQMLHVAADLSDEKISLEASAAISARLGPFAMAVDRLGTRAVIAFNQPSGNLGLADLKFQFKPPSGIGLSLDSGPISGGGYLYIDEELGQYAGVLELSFGPVSIKAIAVLTTKLPPPAEGWALLLLVYGEFPPVQLGFGFTLNGVGGIIGLQHGVSIDALQAGLRSGVLDAILFPRDPVANAPSLIAQLRIVFPIIPRALTIGPALKLGWSTPPLITVTLGLILQFDDVLGSGPGDPSLSRIVLLGQLKVQIPPVDALGADAPALIQLLVDVVGAYDVREQALSIDAVLRDSHIALLPITGSMVVRARFGADPTLVLAVGGFHPRFTDLPPGIPPQTRIGFQLQYGIITIRVVGYFAMTSNSVQTGAEASLVAKGGSFRVEAFIGFDALFLFEPNFHFVIDFRLGAAIRYKSISLASVRFQGRLLGPGRWEVNGSATIELLFFDVDIDVSVGWGEALSVPQTTVSVGRLIADALAKPESWAAQLPLGGATLVSLRSVTGGTDVLAHPLGEVSGMQKVVPLGIKVDRIGRSRPANGNQFTLTKVKIGTVEEPVSTRDEHFARGEFLDMSEEEKLSHPSFERFPAGLAVSSSKYTVGETQIAFEPEWETFFLGQDRPSVRNVLDPALIVTLAGFGSVSRSELRRADRSKPGDAARVSVSEARYASVKPLQPVLPGTAIPTKSFTEALQLASVPGELVTDIAELLAA